MRWRKSTIAPSTSAAAPIATNRSLGTGAPARSVVPLSHAGPEMNSGSDPHMPSNSATDASESPTVTSTCSMCRS
ncbi:Uncharacterised protein [Mycobacteroides abscessus]|nr:Uncharacterised protein [Mycobacteroides abscessus]